MNSRLRFTMAGLATLAVLVPLGWLWRASLLPASYSVMDMGIPDSGGKATSHPGHHGRPVTSFIVDPHRTADVEVTLVARKEGDRFTFNGTTPGPVIRVNAGQLLSVRLVNESVPDGVVVHWHGVDVPGAEDGVAGVTQQAVAIGGEHTYRFVADQVGTYWYHSHQVSHEQVQKGLFGALVIDPVPAAAGRDVVAVTHLYAGKRTINGQPGDLPVRAEPGERVRVRVVNTDNGLIPVWVAGSAYRLVAIDGTDVREPGEVRDQAVNLTAGARADLEVTAPARVHIGGPTGVLLGSDAPGAQPRPSATLDPLGYGSPAPLGFDPGRPDRDFGYDIGRRPGFLDGKPGLYWTINGRLYPDVPMFMVSDGDVVRMRIHNGSGEPHPMHLHGHHVVVLSRNGVPATGSPWWVDSLEVGEGDTFEIAFVADNPGLWMDHCHNLPHAREGLVAHLMYEGVTTPFLIGHDRPE